MGKEVLKEEEKTNLCMFYLCVFERLQDIVENRIYIIIDEIYHGDTEVGRVLQNQYKNKDGSKKQNLKNKEKLELSIIGGLLTNEDKQTLKQLTILRNTIVHEPWEISFNDITVDYFQLDTLLQFFKHIVKVVCQKICLENGNDDMAFFKEYSINMEPLQILGRLYLYEEKFAEYRLIIKEPMTIN